MKRYMTLAAMLLAVGTTAAFAKEVTGTIAGVDKSGDAITMSDGETFTLPEGIEAESLHVGEKVKVNYSMNKAGAPVVSSIRAIK